MSLARTVPSLRDSQPQLFPSKRKLDEFSEEDDYDGEEEPLKMPRSSPHPHNQPCYYTPSPLISFPSISDCFDNGSSSSSSDVLHFFVRTSSKTLVIHARSGDTVDQVIAHISKMTGMPVAEQRLIYRGRQLDDAATIGQCGVQNDALLELTGRLRSTRHPRAWQVANDLVSAACCLGSAEGRQRPRYISAVEALVKEFLTMTPPTTPPPPSPAPNVAEPDAAAGHLQVFIMAGAHAALVNLYLSRCPDNRVVAEKAIRLFLSTDSDYLTRDVQTKCVTIVMEFCRLLAGTAGNKDPLYISCRTIFGSLLEAQDSRFYNHSSTRLVREIVPFVTEVAGTVLACLLSDNMHISSSDLQDFSNFMLAMRRSIKEWMGGSGQIPKLLYNGSHPRYEEWIGSLHGIFIELLKRIDQCLKKVEDYLAQKGPVQSENCWNEWSLILNVLAEANVFSKIYEGAGELLHSVLLARRFPLNALLRRAKRNDKLRWVLKHKDVTDFEARRNLVLMMFPEGKDEYDELHEMLIDRSQLLAESFEYITQAEASALHGGLFMEFKNEEATGPGVLREWFCLVCKAIFNPQNVLFLPCPNDHRRFFPNPTSAVDPLHLKYFGFCGRIIALALMHKVQVGIVFDRVFFLQLAGRVITLEDVKDADPCLYMSCKKVLEMDAELLDSDVLGLTFVREIEELGTRKSVDLCSGGKDIIVNSNNREEYVNLLIQHHFVTSISEQVTHFAQGFGDILSSSKLQKFFFQSLELEDFDRMLGGSESVISVKEWKAHTEYNGYRAKDRQICWFWKIVEGMSVEQQRVLLFFWTSVKFLPVDGFGGLASKLYIYRTQDSHDRLPTSHTCFYRLCLPQYPTISIMRDRLQFITQEHVSCTFGIW